MSIDLANEQTISLGAAARMLPPGRRGAPVNLSTILRWVIEGVNTPGGKVRLEGLRCGGRWITSIEALERFCARQTPDLDAEQPKMSRSPSARERAADRARRNLERAGI